MDNSSIDTLDFKVSDLRVGKPGQANELWLSVTRESVDSELADVEQVVVANSTCEKSGVEKRRTSKWEIWAWGVIVCCGIYVAVGLIMQISKTAKLNREPVEITEVESAVDDWMAQTPKIDLPNDTSQQSSVASLEFQSVSALESELANIDQQAAGETEIKSSESDQSVEQLATSTELLEENEHKIETALLDERELIAPPKIVR